MSKETPTPGVPLSAEGVKLLKAEADFKTWGPGDLLRHAEAGLVWFHSLFGHSGEQTVVAHHPERGPFQDFPSRFKLVRKSAGAFVGPRSARNDALNATPSDQGETVGVASAAGLHFPVVNHEIVGEAHETFDAAMQAADAFEMTDDERAEIVDRAVDGFRDDLKSILTTPSDEGEEPHYREDAKLPDGAICGTDDGQTVWLESSTGGAHRLGMWGGLSLRFTEADGSFVIRDYVATDATTTPAPGSDGLETVKWQYRTASHRQWHDCNAEHAHVEVEIGSEVRELVTREAAEKRIGEAEAQSQLLRKMFDDVDARCVSAESQVAALTAALEDALGLHQVTHIHALIRSALALKEGR